MPTDRFALCLAETLREEEGHDQAVGGPYIRGRYAYSDDPDDSGGKTMMGILQREYDPYRRSKGHPTQWVKLITDDELTEIYQAQFWRAVRAGELPAGLDLAVWDMGVNCGVGTAAKKLQIALGVTADGHIGQITLDAATRAEPIALIHKFSDLRRTYHRGCRTFWKHGKNWLERTARIEAKACAMVQPSMPAPAPPPVDYEARGHTAANTINARADAPPPTPPKGTEAMLGAAGTTGIATAMGNSFKTIGAAKTVTSSTVLYAFLGEPLFWVSAIAVFGAVFTFLWRRKFST